METRNIKLTLAQAKELYKQGGSFRSLALGAYTEEELTKPSLPKNWEEWKEQNSEYEEEWCIGADGEIVSFKDRYRNTQDDSMLATREDAEAILTLIKLKRLRDCYRQGWEPNWKEKSTSKYFITSMQNEVIYGSSTTDSYWLSFETPQIRDVFLGYFRDMIEKVKEFI